MRVVDVFSRLKADGYGVESYFYSDTRSEGAVKFAGGFSICVGNEFCGIRQESIEGDIQLGRSIMSSSYESIRSLADVCEAGVLDEVWSVSEWIESRKGGMRCR